MITNNYTCLPSCFSKKKIVETKVEEVPKSPSRFQSLVKMAVNSFRSNKTSIITDDQCKICKKKYNNDEKVCNCLIEETHPTNKETKAKIHEKYMNQQELVNQIIHIDKNPNKLVHLVNDIYEIVERTSLQEDLTPKTMAKVKENLVNQICVHLEDYIKDHDE
jgi:hypothetical protein